MFAFLLFVCLMIAVRCALFVFVVCCTLYDVGWCVCVCCCVLCFGRCSLFVVGRSLCDFLVCVVYLPCVGLFVVCWFRLAGCCSSVFVLRGLLCGVTELFRRSLLAVCCLLFVNVYLAAVNRCLLAVVWCLLFGVRCLMFVVCFCVVCCCVRFVV